MISELGSQNSMTSGVGHWHHFCDKWLECWYHAKVISLVIFSSFCFCIPSSALQRSLQIFCTWVFLIWMLHIYVELAGSVLHQNSISFACWHCLDTTDQRVIFFVCLINFSISGSMHASIYPVFFISFHSLHAHCILAYFISAEITFYRVWWMLHLNSQHVLFTKTWINLIFTTELCVFQCQEVGVELSQAERAHCQTMFYRILSQLLSMRPGVCLCRSWVKVRFCGVDEMDW